MKVKTSFRLLPSTFAIGLLTASFGMGGALVSCSDNDNISQSADSTQQTIVQDLEPLPTTDQLEETFESKAVILGDNREDFNGCVVNRMKNVTTDISDDVKAFVFTESASQRFTVDDVNSMFKAYCNNATFVLIDPIKTDRTALVDTMRAAIGEAVFDGDSTALASQMINTFTQYASLKDAEVDGRTEAVAVNRNGIYVVRSLEEAADDNADNAEILQVTESGDTIRSACADEEYTPNDYDHGKSADLLVSWMTRCSNAGKKLFATGATSNDGQLNAQMVTVQQYLGPTRAMKRKMLCEFNFEIYALHKSEANEDYYLVHLTPTFHNSQLDCMENNKTGNVISYCWTKVKDPVTLEDGRVLDPNSSENNKYWYGPYFKAAELSLALEGTDEEISMMNILPESDTEGGGTLTSGLNCTVSDVCTLSQSSLWGGVAGQTVNFAQSFTHQNHGLLHLREGSSGNKMTSIFAAVTTPKRIYPVNHPSLKSTRSDDQVAYPYPLSHSCADVVQIFDFSEDLTLTYVVKNPKPQKTYNLRFNNAVYVGELAGALINNREVEAVSWLNTEQVIPLTMPLRPTTYEISCSDESLLSSIEQKIKDQMKESLTTTWSGTYPCFNVYGSTVNACEQNARHVFYRFSQLLYVVANKWNLNNEATFTLHEKGSDKELLKFKLKNKIIES